MLFLCAHNAGRSQMALGLLPATTPATRAIGWSGGSEPGNEVNPSAIAAMAERGIDISGEYPKPWTDEVVRAADVVITMGCGDACPIFPGKRYEEWVLDDPAGLDLGRRPPIRDEIERRVLTLLAELHVPGAQHRMTTHPRDTPQVVFACRKNGGRSVISRVLTEHYAGDRVDRAVRRHRARRADQVRATARTATPTTAAPSHCGGSRSPTRNAAARPHTGISGSTETATAAGT